MTNDKRKSLVRSYLGKVVKIKIDRAFGTAHPEYPDMIYPVNYGYIPNVMSGDGEELDVYLLGVPESVAEYTAKVIGIVHRINDAEDKLVAAPEGMIFYQNEIAEAVNFQEQYYKTKIESIFEKSCGTVLYTVVDGIVHYVLLQADDGYCGFPKGHMEPGESEVETAFRETWEETSIKSRIISVFRREHSYLMGNGKTKNVVYFLADGMGQIPKHNPGFECRDYLVLPFNEACAVLTFENTKELLYEADEYLQRVL